eukprot:468500-Pleurochrysis_carterae.AAC.2
MKGNAVEQCGKSTGARLADGTHGLGQREHERPVHAHLLGDDQLVPACKLAERRRARVLACQLSNRTELAQIKRMIPVQPVCIGQQDGRHGRAARKRSV